MGKSLEEWKDRYVDIGKEQKYSEHEIKMYGSFIHFLSGLPENRGK